MFSNIFKNKTVLITGHTGFKGSWASLWLNQLGANVVGISDREVSNPSNFSVLNLKKYLKNIKLDIRDKKKFKDLFTDISPDFIFHFAAQSLVASSFKNPFDTFTSNTIGTLNVLDAIRENDKDIVSVFITSDKVYFNSEWIWGYRENDQLGGYDPYSASKAMAELVISSYFQSFYKNTKIKIGIGRAGNVIGGGDWSPNRIVPDCIKAWYKNKSVNIRNPNSTRPWQFVLEPISGYFALAEKLANNRINSGEAFNFGPNILENFSVINLLNEMKKYCKTADFTLEKTDNLKESNLLKLNCDKAMSILEWKASLNFEETIYMTMDWYRKFYDTSGKDMLQFSLDQISTYTKKASNKKLKWTK